jgi:hypothetical protein
LAVDLHRIAQLVMVRFALLTVWHLSVQKVDAHAAEAVVF